MSGVKRTSNAGPSSSSGGGNAGAGGSSKRARAVIEDLERLKCPNCLEFPRAEVYQCSKGHSVCSFCVEKLTNCPTCRASYVTGRGSNRGRHRNHLAEGILEAMLFDCSWKEQGCKRKGLSRQQHSIHEGKCQHNPNVKLCQMLFPVSRCAYKVSRTFFKCPIQDMSADFRDHLLNSHPINLFERFIGVRYGGIDKAIFLTDGSRFSYSDLLQLKKDNMSPDVLGYFMFFGYKDTSSADPKLSWFFVQITDKPQGFNFSVKFTIKRYVPTSLNNAVGDDGPNIETSWNGRIMGLTEFNEFKTKAVGEREKFSFSLSLSNLREYYLNAEGEAKVCYEFSVAPIN